MSLALAVNQALTEDLGNHPGRWSIVSVTRCEEWTSSSPQVSTLSVCARAEEEA